jgi:hypothetical protein
MTNTLSLTPVCWEWEVPDTFSSFNPFTRIEEWQAGRCGICGKLDTLVMDHDHETDLCRGMICRSCNYHESVDSHSEPYASWRRVSVCSLLKIDLPYTPRTRVSRKDKTAFALRLDTELMASLKIMSSEADLSVNALINNMVREGIKIAEGML